VIRAPFRERLAESIAVRGAPLCVGLDPDPEQIPRSLGEGADALRRHTLAVVEATSSFAAAYKPNLAFFERFGASGFAVLEEVIQAASRHAPVIADAKLGDIGSTALAYAEAIYDVLGADACTVNGYLGADSIEPFLAREDRFAFIVCRTSNPGASDIQDLLVGEQQRPLYLEVARRAVEWNGRGNVGLVAGATWPAEIGRIREVARELPILLPGVGRQGADLGDAVHAAAGRDGTGSYLVSSSRAIGHASSGEDFAEAAGQAASDLHDQLRQITRAGARINLATLPGEE
jgi:orotidine-5'-phosphate decarboxylase